MKWIKSDTGQSVLALWAVYLLYLIFMHRVEPDDPWNRIFFHPAFLVLMPVMAGCIPILGSKPEQAETIDDPGSTPTWSFPLKPRRTIPDSARRVLLVWLTTLIMFASPHGIRGAYIDPLMHQPSFLILAPPLLAGISLFTPWTIPTRSLALPRTPPLSRAAVRKGIASCVLLGAILVGILFFINDTLTPANHTAAFWSNIFFLGCLIATLMRARYLVKLLSTAR